MSNLEGWPLPKAGLLTSLEKLGCNPRQLEAKLQARGRTEEEMRLSGSLQAAEELSTDLVRVCRGDGALQRAGSPRLLVSISRGPWKGIARRKPQGHQIHRSSGTWAGAAPPRMPTSPLLLPLAGSGHCRQAQPLLPAGSLLTLQLTKPHGVPTLKSNS